MKKKMAEVGDFSAHAGLLKAVSLEPQCCYVCGATSLAFNEIYHTHNAGGLDIWAD
jgi:hypothetical protein